jgi:excinuclease ABC subunit A
MADVKSKKPAPTKSEQIAGVESEEAIHVFGARVHNLKNIDISIPKNKMVVITGISGSGKSSLAFDTIYAEGQRRYMESFGAYARQFIGDMERPDVDKITGLSPVISIEQKTTNKNPRSTVGTITEVYDFLRLLFARVGEAYSYNTGKKWSSSVKKRLLIISIRNLKERRSPCLPHWCVDAKGIIANCLKIYAKKVISRFALTAK